MLRVDAALNGVTLKAHFLLPETEFLSCRDLDLVLVPGIAFDLIGGRLGYGRGYYDRFLKKTEGFRVGVCYESQVVDQVPMEAHDIHMQALISQKGFQNLS